MRRYFSWIATNTTHNIAQIFIAGAALTAVIYGIYEYEQNKDKAKIDVSNEAIKRMTESLDRHTAVYYDLMKSTSETPNIIRKIIKSEPFQLNSHYRLISDYKGNVSEERSNEIRFGIVKFLNAWENMSILYVSGAADCDVLYKNRMASLVKEKYFFRRFQNFIEAFEEVNDSKGSSWNNFVTLNRNIRFYCSGQETDIHCLKEIDRKDCNLANEQVAGSTND
jgi:hypothetical protein